MKKNLFKVLSLALVALFAMTCVASAAAVEGSYADGTVTATVTGIGTTDEVTILVVPHGTDLATVKAEDIIYIDQVTAAEGTATFTFASEKEIDIYSGYTSMDVAQGALSDIYEVIVPPVTAPEIDMEKTKMYANAFSITGYKRIFVKLVEGNGAWMPAHSDETSEIYYSTEREGYDGLIKTTATDIATALTELTWENVAPTDEQTIAMYGDINASKTINMADVNGALKDYKRLATNDIKTKLLMDVSNDGRINMGDVNALLKKYKRLTTDGFAVALDK